MLENARFHHIGFAVNDIEKVKPEYVAGGYVVSETVIEPIQKVYVAYACREGFLLLNFFNRWMRLLL